MFVGDKPKLTKYNRCRDCGGSKGGFTVVYRCGMWHQEGLYRCKRCGGTGLDPEPVPTLWQWWDRATTAVARARYWVRGWWDENVSVYRGWVWGGSEATKEIDGKVYTVKYSLDTRCWVVMCGNWYTTRPDVQQAMLTAHNKAKRGWLP